RGRRAGRSGRPGPPGCRRRRRSGGWRAAKGRPGRGWAAAARCGLLCGGGGGSGAARAQSSGRRLVGGGREGGQGEHGAVFRAVGAGAAADADAGADGGGAFDHADEAEVAGAAQLFEVGAGREAAAVVVDADAEQAAVDAREDLDPGRAGVAVGVLHGLRGDGEELSGDGRGDGRGGGAGGPAGGGQSGPGVEVVCAGGEFGQDVGAVAGVGLAAQVGEEFAGFGGGAAGGAGDESGLLPDAGGGRGDGRGGGAGGPAGGGQSGPGVEVVCAGGEFGQDVGAVAGVGLAAQVGEEFAGFGGGAAGGAGDESGLLPDAGGVDVRG